jgi:hypothetical protein
MTLAERWHKEKVTSLGCRLCCLLHGCDPGPVELHHLRTGGWGKGDYKTLMGLCYLHHRGAEGIHALGTKAWEKRFNVTQKELLSWTLAQV